MEVLYALESASYPVIVILSSFSWGTNLFASEITKIASRYGFAFGVCGPLQPRGGPGPWAVLNLISHASYLMTHPQWNCVFLLRKYMISSQNSGITSYPSEITSYPTICIPFCMLISRINDLINASVGTMNCGCVMRSFLVNWKGNIVISSWNLLIKC